MAYNEAVNIAKHLDALLLQDTGAVKIKRIIVVSSGCTDGTDEIVRAFCARDARVQLLTQEKREGKASAVNLFLKHVDDEIIIMQSADTLPRPGALRALLAPFSDPAVGMVGGHPVPLNTPDTFLGFGVNLLWSVHHQVCLHRPKMGELVAFRNVFRQIPPNTPVDEASIEPLIIAQGLQLRYAPGAVVFNRGPERMDEYILQRRRIFAGHLYVKDTQRYRVATLDGLYVLFHYLKTMNILDGRYWTWGVGIVALEVVCRLLGFVDYRVLRKNPFNWPVAKSTKTLVSG